MHVGGAERVVALLSNFWAGKGHQVTVMPTFSGRGQCLHHLDERVHMDFLADRVFTHKPYILNKLLRLIALRSAIFEIKPDVILSFLSDVNIAAILAAYGTKVPVIVSERIYPPAMPLSSLLERFRAWTYPHAHAVVVQSQLSMAWLKRCCPKAFGYVIANPVEYPLPRTDPEINCDDFLGKNRKLVLAVGRLAEQKGFDLLLSAFKQLANRYFDWDLVILGEGPERKELEHQRKQLGLSNRAFMLGRVGNLSDWYSRADFFVLSSRFEGFPNALAEAMAHGLPAVSYDCRTGPRDIIRNRVDGYLLSPESGVIGLAETMKILIENESLRRQMGYAAQTIRQRFSIERIGSKWESVLGLHNRINEI